jgi:prenyltransferase beta subunit
MVLRILSSITLTLALLAAPAAAQEVAPPESTHPLRGDEINDEQRRSVERGLTWLAARQNPDGSFGTPGSAYGAQVGVTALSGIALMSAGNLPGRGKYGENVQRAVDFLVRHTQQSGLIATEHSHGVMYSHGFATLFLAEVYGMTHDEQVKEALQRAVRLIQRTQNDEGGWRYNPVPADADISVTICQVMALRAARDAGIRVERSVVEKAIQYVRNCQNRDGGYNYTARAGGGGSAFPRSAAGVATLYYAGIIEGEELERGLDYLMRFRPRRGGSGRVGGHYYYGHYYAVQAMFLAGGEHWAQWYPAIRDELIDRQDSQSGAWSGEVNDEYASACALIILQMPNRYLPVFHGKGPGG